MQVEVEFDHGGGNGWLYVGPEAVGHEIQVALAIIEEAGYEALDPLETGDDAEEDDQGRLMHPLVRKGG
ncbi:hypothetical protein [Micromonospora sp. NBC_01813]|uniref:hypothetical protein n=1 Tax=Micromonospora sp. NBC_01813 TaxID=2975988 RepID=UPI002DDBAE54|nr:hypothetical protein [Micromonospora sp. NBC_01813]WSA11565.1 hypothetical protein OG958_12720 [Micromonospora sp. NBC_01813]